MRVIVDESAWGDLNSIGAWIAKDSPKAARQVLDMILLTIEHIGRFPRLSRKGRVRGTRECVVSGTPYIIVFEILEKQRTTAIAAVVHGARER